MSPRPRHLLAASALLAAALAGAATWSTARLFTGFEGGGRVALQSVWLPAAPHLVLSLILAAWALARPLPAWLVVLAPAWLYWGFTGLATGASGGATVTGLLPLAARGAAVANLAVAGLLAWTALRRR